MCRSRPMDVIWFTSVARRYFDMVPQFRGCFNGNPGGRESQAEPPSGRNNLSIASFVCVCKKKAYTSRRRLLVRRLSFTGFSIDVLASRETRLLANSNSVGLQFPTTRTWKLLSIGETFIGAGLPFVIGVVIAAPVMTLVR